MGLTIPWHAQCNVLATAEASPDEKKFLFLDTPTRYTPRKIEDVHTVLAMAGRLKGFRPNAGGGVRSK